MASASDHAATAHALSPALLLLGAAVLALMSVPNFGAIAARHQLASKTPVAFALHHANLK